MAVDLDSETKKAILSAPRAYESIQQGWRAVQSSALSSERRSEQAVVSHRHGPSARESMTEYQPLGGAIDYVEHCPRNMT